MSLLQAQPELVPDLVACCLHTAVFGKVFFPDALDREFNEFHDEMFSLLDDVSLPKVAIAAPRGLGKTTLTIMYALKAAVFKEANYICIVSQTADLAAQIVRTIGNLLTSNERLIKTFGNLQGPIWSLGIGHLKLANGVTIKAKGSGQQIRGQQDEFMRPDLVICDDLEDSEPFRLGDPTDYLKKLKQWFKADLLNSLSRKNPRIILVGTVLGADSVLQNLLDSKNWLSVRLELCDDNYKSNFPDFYSDAEVLALKNEYEEDGQLDLFYQEYRNIPVAAETAIFKKATFQYYPDTYDPEDDYQIDRLVIIDPAKTTNPTSAYSAVVGVGFNPIENHIYFMDCFNERVEPDGLYQAAVDMAIRLKTKSIAVEVTGLNNFITYPLDNFLRQKGFPPSIKLNARGKKQERIRQLAPFYRQRQVYHNPDPKVHNPLEAQLMTFDRSKYWDVMDAFAYCIELFAIGERYFGPEGSDNEDLDALERDIARMDEEETFFGDGPVDAAFWAP